MNKCYRKLSSEEVAQLTSQMCTASDWDMIEVSEGFSAKYVKYARFSGKIRLGAFRKVFTMPGGMHKHSGIYYATLHKVGFRGMRGALFGLQKRFLPFEKNLPGQQIMKGGNCD